MKTLWVALLANLLAPFSAMAEVKIKEVKIKMDRPWGGWRNSAAEKVKFTQTVNYPASSVSMQEGQSEAGQIRGEVFGLGELDKDPFLLIVNGISMPMRVEPESGAGTGKFARPYSFGGGSNSVEVRSPDNSMRSRVQFYEAYEGGMQSQLRVVLSWDTDGTDLDLHVITPDGKHCFYGNRVLENGSALDVDVTTGYGPEIFSSPAPVPGTYLVYVNYYGSGNQSALTVAKVSVITHENTPDEKMETATVPMRTAGDLTLVHSFVYP